MRSVPFAPVLPPLLLAMAFGLPRKPRWAAPALVAPIAIVTGLQLSDVRETVAGHEEDTATLHTSTVGLDGLSGAFDTLAEQPSEVKVLVDPRR